MRTGEVTREQFVWGLSNGVIVLSIAAAFWMGLAAWTLGPGVLLIAALPILLLSGFLIQHGYRLRRLAPGFSRASLRNPPKGSSIQRIALGMNLVSAGETFGVALAGIICWNLHRLDLLWPLIGLVVSLHFIPLGWVVNVRPYMVLGAVGTAIAPISIVGFDGSARTVAIGSGLGLAIVGCVAYLIANAAALAPSKSASTQAG